MIISPKLIQENIKSKQAYLTFNIDPHKYTINYFLLLLTPNYQQLPLTYNKWKHYRNKHKVKVFEDLCNVKFRR